MEAQCSAETLVDLHHSTQCCIPEHSALHQMFDVCHVVHVNVNGVSCRALSHSASWSGGPLTDLQLLFLWLPSRDSSPFGTKSKSYYYRRLVDQSFLVSVTHLGHTVAVLLMLDVLFHERTGQ
jgi:hypothetical protein